LILTTKVRFVVLEYNWAKWQHWKCVFIEEDYWPLNTVLYVKDFHGNDPRFIFIS